MTTALTLFHFEKKPLTVQSDEMGDLIFSAPDVCRALGLSDVTSTLRVLDDDEKGPLTVRTPGGEQIVNGITEPGLYKLISRSRKQEARRFDRWVRHEVLPAIRKTGGYMAATSEEIMATALLPVTTRMDAQEARLATLVERLETAMTAYDPSAGFTTDYRPMRFFVENAGVLQKGRGDLIRKMSRRCVNWLLRNDMGGSIRWNRDKERKLFHVDVVPRWMQFEGAEMIRAHMDKMTGQGTLAPKGKKGRTELSPRPFSRPKEAAS